MLKMDGQHKRKHRLWFGKIKCDSKRQKQMAQAGGGKDQKRNEQILKDRRGRQWQTTTGLKNCLGNTDTGLPGVYSDSKELLLLPPSGHLYKMQNKVLQCKQHSSNMGSHKAHKRIKILHFKLMYIFVFFGLSTILPPAIYLNCNILKFCCKQQNFCCLLFLNQSITTCVHLPKNTATSVQVILLCHVKGNKI